MAEIINIYSPINTDMQIESEVNISTYVISVIDTLLNLFSNIKVSMKITSELELEEV